MAFGVRIVLVMDCSLAVSNRACEESSGQRNQSSNPLNIWTPAKYRGICPDGTVLIAQAAKEG